MKIVVAFFCESVKIVIRLINQATSNDELSSLNLGYCCFVRIDESKLTIIHAFLFCFTDEIPKIMMDHNLQPARFIEDFTMIAGKPILYFIAGIKVTLQKSKVQFGILLVRDTQGNGHALIAESRFPNQSIMPFFTLIKFCKILVGLWINS